jgi:hypothetical protein
MIGSTSRMQGKEASEQETKAKSNVGIDVSKDWLDGHALPSGEALRVPNSKDGIRKLKRWLARFEIALIVANGIGPCAGASMPRPSRSLSSIRSGCACSPRPKASSPRPTGSMPACWPRSPS